MGQAVRIFHSKRHPDEMGRLETEAFFTNPAVVGNVAPSTQNQALNAVVYRTVQELLGHHDVSTTMIYTHVLKQGGLAVKSPLDLA